MGNASNSHGMAIEGFIQDKPLCSDQKELCSQLADALRQLVEGRAKAGQPAVALCMLSCQEPDCEPILLYTLSSHA